MKEISALKAEEITEKALTRTEELQKEFEVRVKELKENHEETLTIIFERLEHAAMCGLTQINISNPALLKEFEDNESAILELYFQDLGYDCSVTIRRNILGNVVTKLALKW